MNLRISTAPQIRQGITTRMLMAQVLIALVPCALMGVYRFGLSAALLLIISMCTAVVAEYACQKLCKRTVCVSDLSALVTGLILGLNLPPQAPWWVAVIGSAFAILIVKQLFGGLGDNFVNPAMAARAVLLSSFPVQMTTFIQPVNNPLAMAADATSGATPLLSPGIAIEELLLGNIAGSIGEVSKLMILIGLVYLLATKVINWRIPVCMLLSTAIAGWLFGYDPLYTVLTGGVLFGATFMATDYTTTPMTALGQIIFGVAAGFLVILIRKFGAYPEGVTYAILLMNVVTPLLDKYIRPKLYGQPKKEKKEAQANA